MFSAFAWLARVATSWLARPAPEPVKKATAELRCGTCAQHFPVYREMKPSGPVTRDMPALMNNGYICFLGADGARHHLVYWLTEKDEDEEDWEVVCGGCRRAVPLPARPADRRIPSRAPRYAPAFGCPGHLTAT